VLVTSHHQSFRGFNIMQQRKVTTRKKFSVFLPAFLTLFFLAIISYYHPYDLLNILSIREMNSNISVQEQYGGHQEEQERTSYASEENRVEVVNENAKNSKPTAIDAANSNDKVPRMPVPKQNEKISRIF
jgi:hypothetical protein